MAASVDILSLTLCYQRSFALPAAWLTLISLFALAASLFNFNIIICLGGELVFSIFTFVPNLLLKAFRPLGEILIL